ncbi:MAG: zf-HC2 domain-containing protein [Acidobacteria bacterium]|nr:zf-HC2 domain-containing protein [Acidobacteriota bacterium]
MNRTTHPIEREDLMAWLDGELSPERAASVAAHVKVCDECLALAEELRRVSAQMAAWKVEPAPASLDARVSDALQRSRFRICSARAWPPTKPRGSRWSGLAWRSRS